MFPSSTLKYKKAVFFLILLKYLYVSLLQGILVDIVQVGYDRLDRWSNKKINYRLDFFSLIDKRQLTIKSV